MGNFDVPECNNNQEAIILLQEVKCTMQKLIADFCPHFTEPLTTIDVVQMYLDPTFDTNNFDEYKERYNRVNEKAK